MGFFDFLGFGQTNGGGYQPPAYDNKSATRLGQYAENPSLQYQDTMASNPFLAALLGQGGAYDKAGTRANDLLAQEKDRSGFQLNSQDREAYGQASGDITRQFGNQENQVANSLASRGFGGGDSGLAGAAFSGLAGTKNEQLAKAQTQIADARMQFAQKSLADTRKALTDTWGFMDKSAGTGNLAVRGQAEGMYRGSTAYDNSYGTHNDALAKAHQQNVDNTNPTLGQMFGAGLGAGASDLGMSLIPSAQGAGRMYSGGEGSGASAGSRGLGGPKPKGGYDPAFQEGGSQFVGPLKPPL